MIIDIRRCKAGIMRDNASHESCFAVRDHECDSHCRTLTNFAPVTKLVRLSVRPSVHLFVPSIDSNPKISTLPNVRQAYANCPATPL